jgi:invasin B
MNINLTTPAGPRPSVDPTQYQQHAKAASDAILHDKFTEAATLAFKELNGVHYNPGVEAGQRTETAGGPSLALPRVQLPSDSRKAEDTFTLLMAQLIAILGDTEVSTLKNRLELLKSMAKASTDAFQQKSAAYQAAVGELESAVAAAEVGAEHLQALRANVERAALAVASAQGALEGLQPGTPEYAAAEQTLQQAQAQLDSTRSLEQKAQITHARLLQQVQVLGSKVEGLAGVVQMAVIGPLPQAVAEDMKKQLNAAATLTLLMLQFAELMGESSENQLETQQALFEEMQAARQAYLEEKSVEYQKQVEAAEKMSKLAKCLGQILGGIVMVVGAVVAVAGVLTGGAASIGGAALFAVGLGLTGGDMLAQHLTGESYMAKAMQPLMDHVIMPVVQLGVKMMTELFQMLESTGLFDLLQLPENFAEMAGAVVGSVAAMVAMVAAVVVISIVGGPAASKVAERLGDVAGKVIGKMIPLIVEHMAKSSLSTLQQAFKPLANLLAKNSVQAFLNVGKIVLTVGEAGGAVVAAGFTAASGVHQKRSADALSEVQLVQHISQQLQDWMSQMVTQFSDTGQVIAKEVDQAFQTLQLRDTTAMEMVRRIKPTLTNRI